MAEVSTGSIEQPSRTKQVLNRVLSDNVVETPELSDVLIAYNEEKDSMEKATREQLDGALQIHGNFILKHGMKMNDRNREQIARILDFLKLEHTVRRFPKGMEILVTLGDDGKVTYVNHVLGIHLGNGASRFPGSQDEISLAPSFSDRIKGLDYSKSADFLIGEGEKLKSKNLHKEAIAQFLWALKKAPNDFRALMGAAESYGGSNDYVNQEKYATSALKNAKTPSDKTLAYGALGDSLYSQDKIDTALAVCDEGLKWDPNASQLYINRGWYLSALDRYPEALEAYKKAKELKAPNIERYIEVVEAEIVERIPVKDGKGTRKFANGDVYVGEFKGDKANGIGKWTFTNGDVFTGNFKDDVYSKGTYLFVKDGWKEQGDFDSSNSYKLLNGTITDENGTIITWRKDGTDMDSAAYRSAAEKVAAEAKKLSQKVPNAPASKPAAATPGDGKPEEKSAESKPVPKPAPDYSKSFKEFKTDTALAEKNYSVTASNLNVRDEHGKIKEVLKKGQSIFLTGEMTGDGKFVAVKTTDGKKLFVSLKYLTKIEKEAPSGSGSSDANVADALAQAESGLKKEYQALQSVLFRGMDAKDGFVLPKDATWFGTSLRTDEKVAFVRKGPDEYALSFRLAEGKIVFDLLKQKRFANQDDSLDLRSNYDVVKSDVPLVKSNDRYDLSKVFEK